MAERRNIVIKSLHVSSVGISKLGIRRTEKTNNHRTDDQNLIKERGAADWRQTGPQEKRKPADMG